jgi:hypothetical protein
MYFLIQESLGLEEGFEIGEFGLEGIVAGLEGIVAGLEGIFFGFQVLNSLY